MSIEEQENTGVNKPKRDEHGRLLPGNTANPKGKPKGAGIFSIKTLVKKHLEEHPEDLDEFVRYFVKRNRDLAWKMMEGMPKMTQDVTHTIPQNLIDLIKGNATALSEGNRELSEENTG